MRITFKNFGGWADFTKNLTGGDYPNGYGKTTLVNGYMFALSGKTQTGFEPRYTRSEPTETTEVLMYGFGGISEIRRTVDLNGGSTLYINGSVCTQSAFVQAMEQKGISIALAIACADPNVLTDQNLSSEDLRKTLSSVGVMDNGEGKELRKQLSDKRKQLAIAEQYALSNVIIPERVTPLLTEAEVQYAKDYRGYQCIVEQGLPKPTCVTCGSEIHKSKVAELKADYEEAKNHVRTMRVEAERVEAKRVIVRAETQAIEDAERAVASAKKARQTVVTLKKEVEDLNAQIRTADETAVRAELPKGMELITEQTTKTGAVKSVCAITVDGIPLRSVNRAERVKLCVRLLVDARARAGLEDTLPIIIDNAESLERYEPWWANVICLGVKKNE